MAIVGATGAGKSTLVGLLPRFFDPTGGRVLIDGHDVRDVSLASLREQVAVVLQEPFLFPTSASPRTSPRPPGRDARRDRDARPGPPTPTTSSRACRRATTRCIGERGATLSGGERQRIAIARALLKNAPILILDEPTSALDAETEHAIVEALERLMRGRTTFIVAHRLSTIRSATTIVVLEHGTGRRAGLARRRCWPRGGRYRRLHDAADRGAARRRWRT